MTNTTKALQDQAKQIANKFGEHSFNLRNHVQNPLELSNLNAEMGIDIQNLNESIANAYINHPKIGRIFSPHYEAILAFEKANSIKENSLLTRTQIIDGKIIVAYFDNCSIKDISDLTTISSLQSLELHLNHIQDLSPLRSFAKLESLVLTDNKISEISAISNLCNLTSLDLCDNRIEDISILSNLKQLRYLEISKNLICDLSPLLKLSGLKELFVYQNPLSIKSREIILTLQSRGVLVETI